MQVCRLTSTNAEREKDFPVQPFPAGIHGVSETQTPHRLFRGEWQKVYQKKLEDPEANKG